MSSFGSLELYGRLRATNSLASMSYQSRKPNSAQSPMNSILLFPNPRRKRKSRSSKKLKNPIAAHIIPFPSKKPDAKNTSDGDLPKLITDEKLAEAITETLLLIDAELGAHADDFDYVWACSCGGQVFFLLDDGKTECIKCNHSSPHVGWSLKMSDDGPTRTD